MQRHLGEDDRLRAAHLRLLEELLARPLEQIERELGDGPEAAALDQDRLLVEHLRRLHDLAAAVNMAASVKPVLDELQAHEPVVDAGEGRARRT